MQQKLSTSLEENQKYFRRILRTDKNFDIISRTTMVADRKYSICASLKNICGRVFRLMYQYYKEEIWLRSQMTG